MKKLAFCFFGALSLFFGGFALVSAYRVILDLFTEPRFPTELWSFCIFAAFCVKFLEFTSLALLEVREGGKEWIEYEEKKPISRGIFVILALVFLIVSPLLFFFGMAFDMNISMALYWAIPLPTVVFIYLAMFGKKPDLRPLLTLFSRGQNKMA